MGNEAIHTHTLEMVNEATHTHARDGEDLGMKLHTHTRDGE